MNQNTGFKVGLALVVFVILAVFTSVFCSKAFELMSQPSDMAVGGGILILLALVFVWLGWGWRLVWKPIIRPARKKVKEMKKS